MAVVSKMAENLAIQEAASTGLKSMEHLLRLVSHEPVHVDCREVADFTVSKFKKVISMLDRTGHARFRRGPVQAPVQAPVQVQHPDSFTSLSLAPSLNFAPAKEKLIPSPAPPQTALTLNFTKPNVDRPIGNSNAVTVAVAAVRSKEVFSLSKLMKTPTPTPTVTNSSSFISSITGEGSVSNGKQGSSSMLLLPAKAGKRCREHDQSDDISGSKSTGSGKCHCKKRKFRAKNVIRIPAISSRIADIPGDEFSWRKYGQKPIKGSAYPRGYYKCSSFRGCPARKHVERAMDDPTMLIVTYEGEHRHAQVAMQGNNTQMVNFGSMEEMKKE